jgi:hypothetical protein
VAEITGATATGTILADDVEPVTDQFLSISATDANKQEGDTGSTTMTFTVTRSGDISGSTTVDYVVAGSGINPADAADFAGGVLPGGTVTFAAGELSKTIAVQVAGDTQIEADENFTVQLSSASGVAEITGATATGTILADDVAATSGITVTPTSGLTTKENGSAASFSVILDSQPDQDVIIDVVSQDTSEGTTDVSQLTFTAANWNSAQTVTVTGVDDAVRDGHVTYAIQLTSAESNQGPYAGIDPDDVLVTNQDNEKGGKGGGNSGGKGKPKKGPALGDSAAQDTAHMMDAFLTQFSQGEQFGRSLDLDLDWSERDRAATRLDAALARHHFQDADGSAAEEDSADEALLVG